VTTDTIVPSSAADGQIALSSRSIAKETAEREDMREDISEDMAVTRATKNAADRSNNSVKWRLVLHSSP
jgi:hypothetical protein